MELVAAIHTAGPITGWPVGLLWPWLVGPKNQAGLVAAVAVAAGTRPGRRRWRTWWTSPPWTPTPPPSPATAPWTDGVGGPTPSLPILWAPVGISPRTTGPSLGPSRSHLTSPAILESDLFQSRPIAGSTKSTASSDLRALCQWYLS